MNIPIIYEDESILVINKPAGLLVHGLTVNDTQETLVSWLAEQYPAMGELAWPDPARAGIVHRLDRDTSGVMVIAKTPDVLANLQKQFAEREVEKRYLAMVVGAPEWEEQTVKAPVARSAGTKRRAQYLKLDDRAKDAETHFIKKSEFKNQNSKISLLEAQPKTGRTHQIRVHLGLLGFPILGDPWYRTKASRELTQKLNVPRLMLHAQQLSFVHPTTGERVAFEAPLPADFEMILSLLDH